jgi:A/G-specific adenine glycosylase
MAGFEQTIAGALLRHFDATRRPLPWRDTSDPYAIWVSEVMLQQTRVETVMPYYGRWLDRFPTVEALADAGIDDVLKEWEGLGYYSRARHLHAAARTVRERHGGRVPDDPAALRELPGVGEYTAGAVASIAFGVPLPAVDGNVRRVLSRLYDLEAPGAGELRRRAAALVPEDRPGDFNQAVMELGATICTPRGPACSRCPLGSRCLARQRGVQESRPRPRKAKPIPEEVVRTALLVRIGEDRPDGRGAGLGRDETTAGRCLVLLARRPTRGLLGGLWEFPGDREAPMIRDLVPVAESAAELEPVRHTFSHKRVEYRPEVLRLAGAEGFPAVAAATDAPDLAWVAPDAVDGYALPVAQQKIGRLLLAWLEDAGAAC